ncbi:MAG: DNA-3-methyladenine glycosylase [Chitinophagaceae bacterium]|nr:MAG: DNA-3-methyladenine glycosylase [Chitinophagaceae bacterium]
MERLGYPFYSGADVVAIARSLIGKVLVTEFDGLRTSGRIVETEAYEGVTDKASHAYGGRRTNRTEIMFGEGGKAYIYLCYGLHQMFNIVTNVHDTPHAILIRAVEPMEGQDIMLQRTGKKVADYTLTRGPGNVGKAFGFHTTQNGYSLQGDEIYIADDNYKVSAEKITASPRIGVAYAAEDALLPYRFFIKGNPYVSGKIK